MSGQKDGPGRDCETKRDLSTGDEANITVPNLPYRTVLPRGFRLSDVAEYGYSTTSKQSSLQKIRSSMGMYVQVRISDDALPYFVAPY